MPTSGTDRRPAAAVLALALIFVGAPPCGAAVHGGESVTFVWPTLSDKVCEADAILSGRMKIIRQDYMTLTQREPTGKRTINFDSAIISKPKVIKQGWPVNADSISIFLPSPGQDSAAASDFNGFARNGQNGIWFLRKWSMSGKYLLLFRPEDEAKLPDVERLLRTRGCKR